MCSSLFYVIVLFLVSVQSSLDFLEHKHLRIPIHIGILGILSRLANNIKTYRKETKRRQKIVPLSITMNQGTQSDLKVYEQLFRSPSSVVSCDPTLFISPSDPTPLSLGDNGADSLDATSRETSLRSRDLTSLQSDTDAALLLTSIKKLHVKKESIPLGKRTSNLYIPKLKLKHTPTTSGTESLDDFRSAPSTISKLRSIFDQRHNEDANKLYRRSTTSVPKPRARTVSLDLHRPIVRSHASDIADSSFRIPNDRISLDLTTNLHNSSGSPAQVSPPTSPLLPSIKSIRDLKQEQGPRRLSVKRPSSEVLSSAINGEPMKKRKKQPKSRPSILRPTKEVHTTNPKDDSSEKKVLRKKFSWKSYPELEDFLIANREEYLRHSAMNYTSQQKEYNNRLTERLLELAADCGYVFDEESFSFVSIRDRIRCYFKSYVQSKKKRGLILGYAARRKGLITEEELEKSAGIKGTIVVPKKSSTTKKDK